MIRVEIIQTGTVTIRPHHRLGEEERTAWQRKLDIARSCLDAPSSDLYLCD